MCNRETSLFLFMLVHKSRTLGIPCPLFARQHFLSLQVCAFYPHFCAHIFLGPHTSHKTPSGSHKSATVLSKSSALTSCELPHFMSKTQNLRTIRVLPNSKLRNTRRGKIVRVREPGCKNGMSIIGYMRPTSNQSQPIVLHQIKSPA